MIINCLFISIEKINNDFTSRTNWFLYFLILLLKESKTEMTPPVEVLKKSMVDDPNGADNRAVLQY